MNYIMPTKIANAIAGIYGWMREKPLLEMATIPCPECAGKQRMTVCNLCKGKKFVQVNH